MSNNQQNNSGPNIARNKSSVTISTSKGDELKLGSTIFHDFLGERPTGNVRPLSEASLSASVSLGNGASSGGGRGPISSTSDLGSDRTAGSHIEGVPCYGPRSDFMSPERPNVFVGMKRSYSHSYAATSAADRFPAGRLDSLEGTELMKLLRNAGGDRLRLPCNDDSSSPLRLRRPTSNSLISQPSSVFRTDASASKGDSFIPVNVGPTRQYPPRSSQVVPFGQPSLSHKLRDSNAGQLVTSLTAADEGSRTGIKGSGLMDSLKESGRTSDRNFSVILASSGKQNSSGNISEPESSLSNSQHGLASAGHQMTIFYNGQAHVFDSVHPNKADIIMALAGSNGESWSISYGPQSTATARKSAGENHSSCRKIDAGKSTKQPEVHTKSFIRVDNSRGFSTSEKTDIPAGTTPYEEMTEKESRNSSRPNGVLADKKT